MDVASVSSCTAFAGTRCVASGELRAVAAVVKALLDQEERLSLLIFDDVTSELVELDFRGSLQAVLGRLPAQVAPVTVADSPAGIANIGTGRPAPLLAGGDCPQTSNTSAGQLYTR